MSTRLPLEINPLRLIEKRQILDGTIAVTQFPRLLELLESDEGTLNVHLDFTRTETGKPAIEGKISGDIQLECQRCLNALPFRLNSEFTIVLVTTDIEAEQLQEGYETWMLEDERIFLPDFIEDEVMLSLPLITKHESCEPVKPMVEGLPEDEIDNVDEAVVEDNPFAALKDIKLN